MSVCTTVLGPRSQLFGLYSARVSLFRSVTELVGQSPGRYVCVLFLVD